MAFAHPRLASQSELPDSEKRSHASVDYQSPSRHRDQSCSGCRHFIFSTPPRCQGVRSPIHWDDWCARWTRRATSSKESA